MGMMERKKKIMMMQTGETYIMNGLVLWLDGIDKGNVSGAWVDKIGGYSFTGYNNPIFGTDYVGLSATDNNYLANLSNYSFETPSPNDGTIEVVITDYDNATQVIYMPKSSQQIAFGIYKVSDSILHIIRSAGVSITKVITSTVMKSVSVNNDYVVINGQPATFASTKDNWSGATSNNLISGRVSGANRFTGKIHSIRIYNRYLTQNEMIHNQKIDNKRFNLGLTI